MLNYQLTNDEVEEMAFRVEEEVRALRAERGPSGSAHAKGDSATNAADDVAEQQKEKFVEAAAADELDGPHWWAQIVEGARREVCLPDGKFYQRVHHLREPPPTREIIVLIQATLMAGNPEHRTLHFHLLCYTASVWLIFNIADRGVAAFCKDCAPA